MTLPTAARSFHWIRRLLLVAALLFAGWVLLAAAATTARADDGGAVLCHTTGSVPAPVDALQAVTGDDPVAAALPDSAPACDAPPVPVDGATVPVTPAEVPDPPAPAPVDVPVLDVPIVIPEPGITPPPPDAEPPAPVVDTPVVVPVPVAPAHAPDAVSKAVAEAADRPDALAAAVEKATVDAATAKPTTASEVPVLLEVADCVSTEDGALDDAELTGPFSGPPLGVSGGGRQFAAAAATTTTAPQIAPATAGRNPVPGSPAGPLNLPNPAPAAPACPSAAAGSGTSASGAGHETHADGTYAVLGTRFAATLTNGAVRTASGFVGAIVGGADDPGVRPG